MYNSRRTEIYQGNRLICAGILREVLGVIDHSEDDLNYAISYLCEKFLNSSISRFSLFILFSYPRTYTGTFNLTFRDRLTNAINSRNTEMLGELSVPNLQMFVELSDNRLLTQDEFDQINVIMRKEYDVISDIIRRVIHGSGELLQQRFLCLGSGKEPPVGTTEEYSIYDECRTRVCFEEQNIDDIISVRTNKKKYCFTILEIAEILSNDVPVNPRTGENFSSGLIAKLYQLYGKEAKMYIRYKNKE